MMRIISRANLCTVNFYCLLLMTNEDADLNMQKKMGFLSVILCNSRRLTEYVLIREYKTWNEARNFCQKNYIDLATVQTDEEWSEINKLRANNLSDTWIGLYDDVNSWRWSFRDKRLTYARWDKDQPDNYGGDQDCLMLHSSGYWRDKGCNLKCISVSIFVDL
uniref:C-type lectin domain-containing protein n=1 Tax=Sinocyclocheilus anshuiensis TaxID=1608454 RepID=A0A671P289_9TELE